MFIVWFHTVAITMLTLFSQKCLGEMFGIGNASLRCPGLGSAGGGSVTGALVGSHVPLFPFWYTIVVHLGSLVVGHLCSTLGSCVVHMWRTCGFPSVWPQFFCRVDT